MKKLKVETCQTCPKWDHMGAFGKVSCVPVCRAMKNPVGSKTYHKVIPHDVGQSKYSAAIVAKQHEGFPEWCPLEEY